MEELDRAKKLLNLCKQLKHQNIIYFFSMDHSLVLPSTSSQIPVFNNVGYAPYYYHNSENNNDIMMNASSSYIS